ncbi:MAG: hypothetical protein AAGF83_21585 [Cyanobacteria bacterium P01_G01_bin.67]
MDDTIKRKNAGLLGVKVPQQKFMYGLFLVLISYMNKATFVTQTSTVSQAL